MDLTKSIFARYRHAQLLVALMLLLIADPFLSGYLGMMLLDVFLLITLLSAIVACANTRRRLVIGMSLATVMLAAMLLRAARGVETANIAVSLLAICFFGYVIALVLGSVFRDSRSVSLDTICGGLAVYLLLGILWAFMFALLEGSAPNSFSGVEQGAVINYKWFYGFSFVTLTTLGYGNIVPLTPRAEALAVSEAILGQLYLTVLVARLVALNLVHSRDPSDS